MCESCSQRLPRRQFVVSGSIATSLLSTSLVRPSEGAEAEAMDAIRREKKPAVVKAVFLYPLPKDCDQGTAEASWQEHHWHPYPGNQYGHADQQKKFTEKVREMGKRIGVQIDFAPKVLTTDVEVDRYIVMPGQALSYKIGEIFIMDLRRKVREKEKEKFDIRKFHDNLLRNGALPLPVLGSLMLDG